MPSLTGKLIVVEGLEGAGKSTAVNTVIDLLSKLNIKSYYYSRTWWYGI